MLGGLFVALSVSQGDIPVISVFICCDNVPSQDMPEYPYPSPAPNTVGVDSVGQFYLRKPIAEAKLSQVLISTQRAQVAEAMPGLLMFLRCPGVHFCLTYQRLWSLIQRT